MIPFSVGEHDYQPPSRQQGEHKTCVRVLLPIRDAPQKGSEELSTSANQAIPQPSWKEEVNRRLQAHKSRKGLSVVQEGFAGEEQSSVTGRAAIAAARVAERFSKAPSYSEMQAAEARAALREAEVATRAALEAQAVAQAALANFEWANQHSFEDREEDSEEIWPDTPADAQEPPVAAAPHAFQASPALPNSIQSSPVQPSLAQSKAFYDSAAASAANKTSAIAGREAPDSHTFAMELPQFIDPQPIHANLIHFPREIVATRRIRPRLAGSTEEAAEDALSQLSIFEVDPNSVSVSPMASTVIEAAAPAPSWSGPEWSSIELQAPPEEAKERHGEPPSIASPIELAPLELRLMATAIDLALTVGLVCAGAAGMAGHMTHAPAFKTAEMSALVAVILIGVLYQAFFLMLMGTTPGMMYARISLCTFDNEFPTRNQLRDRLVALLVSLFPMGLGLAWSIFDEDRLCWHDRISRTYLRKC